jgi:TetR/AcrR family fatty acid metabolism transcriptional regulator
MRLRSEKLEDRRRQIRVAATRVFSRKGYHETRIADIANEAGVAYGLVYHYFKNKEEILASIFEDNWAFFVRAIQELGKGEGTFAQRLDASIGLMIESYRIAPEVVSVLVVEIARSPMALDDSRMQGFKKGFLALAEVLSEGQKSGHVRKSLDPMLSAVCLFGAIETILTGMVLKIIPATNESLDRVRKQVGDLFLYGFTTTGKGK